MLFPQRFLSRHPSGLSAYNDLQSRVMRRFLRAGGTLDDWTARYAPLFRLRYGWMLGDAAAVHPGHAR